MQSLLVMAAVLVKVTQNAPAMVRVMLTPMTRMTPTPVLTSTATMTKTTERTRTALKFVAIAQWYCFYGPFELSMLAHLLMLVAWP